MQAVYLFSSFVMILFFAIIWNSSSFANIAVKIVLILISIAGAITIIQSYVGNVTFGAAHLF